jgi:hypothetical protein
MNEALHEWNKLLVPPGFTGLSQNAKKPEDLVEP